MASINGPFPPQKKYGEKSSLPAAAFPHPKDLDTGGSKFIGMDEAQQTESDQGIQVGMVGNVGGRNLGEVDELDGYDQPIFLFGRLKDGTNTTLKYRCCNTKGFFLWGI